VPPDVGTAVAAGGSAGAGVGAAGAVVAGVVVDGVVVDGVAVDGAGVGAGTGGKARITPDPAISKRATELRTASVGIEAARPPISTAVTSPRPKRTRSGGVPLAVTRTPGSSIM
jgi:hypothetical protein